MNLEEVLDEIDGLVDQAARLHARLSDLRRRLEQVVDPDPTCAHCGHRAHFHSTEGCAYPSCTCREAAHD